MGGSRPAAAATITFGGRTLMLRAEGFNLLNHADSLGRAQTVYGDTVTVNQFQVRYQF